MTPPTLELLGVRIDRLTRSEAVARVDALLATPGPSALQYVNAHSLNLACEDAAYRDVLARTALVLNDGVGLSVAGRMSGRPFPDNLNGSDFTPVVLQRATAQGLSVGFYGGRPGVAAEAARRLSAQIPGLRVAGLLDGYAIQDPGAAAQAVAAWEADVLVVALGNPAQEIWIDRYAAQTGTRLATGVGAFLDFTAGRVPRAPAWMNRIGVEWLWRLWQEPGRMWRRYVLGNPRFLLRVARQTLRQRT